MSVVWGLMIFVSILIITLSIVLILGKYRTLAKYIEHIRVKTNQIQLDGNVKSATVPLLTGIALLTVSIYKSRCLCKDDIIEGGGSIFSKIKDTVTGKPTINLETFKNKKNHTSTASDDEIKEIYKLENEIKEYVNKVEVWNKTKKKIIYPDDIYNYYGNIITYHRSSVENMLKDKKLSNDDKEKINNSISSIGDKEIREEKVNKILNEKNLNPNDMKLFNRYLSLYDIYKIMYDNKQGSGNEGHFVTPLRVPDNKTEEAKEAEAKEAEAKEAEAKEVEAEANRKSYYDDLEN